MYKRFLTNEPAGFPLELDKFLKWQQESYSNPIDALAAMVGNMGIITGMLPAGNNTITSGWIFLNGEILFFEGGSVDVNFYIAETKETLVYQGGVIKEVLITKKCLFGVSDVQYAYANLKRPGTLISLVVRIELAEKMLRPLVGYQIPDPNLPGQQITVHGSWLFWGRPAIEIPAGWVAVDDAEWKGRVPVVIDELQNEFNLIGKIGGAKTHTLSENEFTHRHSLIPGGYLNKGGQDGNNVLGIEAGSQNRNTGYVGNSNGVINPHNNLQPYRVVMFIKFIG
ncbi:MAG: hypothetical protein EAZ35_02150 [Sphingobacteriia bacterium]|nr:MAG: hypothetical protein EAZ35_02150 [Sphingobacteriia bacterium]